MQIYENMVTYGKHLPLRSAVIFGGVPQNAQVMKLRRGVDVLVATPGRLNDLIRQGFINLSHVEIFVLDEADRMLDMGFIQDVKTVIALLPAKKQTLFFSATMPKEVEKLALSILDHPVTVKVDPVSSTVDTIDQRLYMVDKVNKKHLLSHLLHQTDVESALVFTRTRHGADRVVKELMQAGIASKAIHGEKSQNARQMALSEFKSGKIHVMVATDIAARGIDIAGLSHVINYDLPNEPEAYVHRIGRTGRAGMEGTALSFCCIDELKDLRGIEKLIQKRLPVEKSAWPMEVMTPTVKQPRGARPAQKARPVSAVHGGAQSKPRTATPRPNQRYGRPAPAKTSQPAFHKDAFSQTEVVSKKDNARGAKRYGRPAPVKAASAEMKATPLQRPTMDRSMRKPASKPSPKPYQQQEQPRSSYQDSFKSRKKPARRSFATGQDRF